MLVRNLIGVVFMCLVLSSCKKEEKTCPLLMDAIVGTWQASALGAGFITFQSDGSLLDDNDLLIGGSAGGASFTNKNWSITGDENNVLTISASAGISTLSSDFMVSSWDCNRITISEFGLTIDFIKT